MATFTLPSIFIYMLFLSLFLCPTLSKNSVYIVHMSHSLKPATVSSTHDWYSSILKSLTSDTNASIKATTSVPNILYTYTHSATGFAAHMSATHASKLRRHPSVLSAIRDEIVRVDTTHSPSYLGLTDGSGLWPKTNYGSDVVVGIIDTGVWPENPSFNDDGYGSVPNNWKGYCESGSDFPASLCNNKLIGARFFYKAYESYFGSLPSIKSARDESGHGTHCATIVGGSIVNNVGYYKYAVGEASGMAPKARIAMYKPVWGPSQRGSTADIVAAIDQAIQDGVDIISMSISSTALEYYQDAKAIAAFRAAAHGVVVSASAGNRGPGASTASNLAPWIFTVAASSIDREFVGEVVLGNGQSFKGATLYDFSELRGNATSYLKLVTGASAGSSVCIQGYLSRSRVAGNIVICDNTQTTPEAKSIAVQQAGGAGLIVVNDAKFGLELRAKPFFIPATTVTSSDGLVIKNYASSNANPTAKIVFKGTVIGPEPSSPRLTAFSSRGPNAITREIIKPDITAPGFHIIGGWTEAYGPSEQSFDPRRVPYSIQSGTSMSTPHIAGLAALLHKAHPSWSPAAIKSAIMTTAYNLDNAGNKFIDLSTGKESSPLVHGSGHVDPDKALDPGLVYDLDTSDYVAFLCSIGYDSKKIAQFVTDLSEFDCRAKNFSSPGDLNYPSLSVVFQSSADVVTYKRVVKNVGSSANAVYSVSVSEPNNVQVSVSPTTLKFSANQQTLSYTITMTSSGGFYIPYTGLESYGSIEWNDGSHTVRSPIAVYWKYSYTGAREDVVASI